LKNYSTQFVICKNKQRLQLKYIFLSHLEKTRKNEIPTPSRISKVFLLSKTENFHKQELQDKQAAAKLKTHHWMSFALFPTTIY